VRLGRGIEEDRRRADRVQNAALVEVPKCLRDPEQQLHLRKRRRRNREPRPSNELARKHSAAAGNAAQAVGRDDGGVPDRDPVRQILGKRRRDEIRADVAKRKKLVCRLVLGHPKLAEHVR
jgi:hypothetical protein